MVVYREDRENKTFDEGYLKRDYDGQRFHRYYQNNRANLISNYVDILEEYRDEYEKELEDSRYVTIEEFTFLDFLVNDS